jgi:hypothetical protein
MKICTTIPEAKQMLVREVLRNGYKLDIQRGSFAGEQYRLQLPYAAVQITNPFFDMVPVPPTIDWPKEQTLSACQAYYHDYLLGESKAKNEEYTYGSRISREDQLDHIISMLTDHPATNQAVITIGDPIDASIDDPACLREIHFKLFGGALNMHTIWRSHDLYGGFGMNMVGLAMLFQDVCNAAELFPGSIYYYSSGSHIYGFHIDLLKPLAGGD